MVGLLGVLVAAAEADGGGGRRAAPPQQFLALSPRAHTR